MFESSPAILEHLLKEKRVPGTSFSNNSFETTTVLIQSHTASHTSVDDNMDHEFNVND